MTKEEELRAEVHALRVEMWKLDKENDNLTAALGSVRAELDNAQDRRGAMINDEREIADANYAAYHVEAERNIELALKVVRLTNALADYALRAVERPMGGEL